MNSDRDHLLSAARLALRGHGRAEPNPLVGCVIVAPGGEVVGWGYHERFGGPHAEIHALRRAGERARGATAYVTLEPCSHTGKTGPCAHALADAGVARVVVAREDPHPQATGGLDAMRRAGVEVLVSDVCPEAKVVSEPFIHRLRTGLPWVTVKWAQTIDGKVATRSGDSKWISSEASRKVVHRERGRTDAIVTGIGSVLRDDPMLTARGVRVRRVARRVVIDPHLKIPQECALVRTAAAFPTTVFCAAGASEKRANALRGAGMEVVLPTGEGRSNGEIDLAALLRDLAARYDATNVLVEAGPGLVSRLIRQNLVNEAWVFIAGKVFGDDCGVPSVRGFTVERVTDGISMNVVGMRTRGGDVILRYAVGR